MRVVVFFFHSRWTNSFHLIHSSANQTYEFHVLGTLGSYLLSVYNLRMYDAFIKI